MSYFSPKIEARRVASKGGWGVFARKAIHAGELLVEFGGYLLSGQEFSGIPVHIQRLSIQVGEDLYLVSLHPEPADRVNHSCDPNTGMLGERSLVAMRNIFPNEEICFDYAMSDSHPYDEFECLCGSSNCRNQFTSTDWQRPDLWQRYEGYFSPYLQKQIDRQYRLRAQ
jgi:hypothetical protein